jgi:hypothetical protein
MKKRSRAVIVYYDEDAGVLKAGTAFLADLMPSHGRMLSVDLPFDSDDVITDEDARKVGGLAIMQIAAAIPELREKLRITTAQPMDWTPVKRPD